MKFSQDNNDVLHNCKDPGAVAVVEGLLNSGASLHIKSDVKHPSMQTDFCECVKLRYRV